MMNTATSKNYKFSLPELHAAIAAGIHSGQGRNADSVFDHLEEKYRQLATRAPHCSSPDKGRLGGVSV